MRSLTKAMLILSLLVARLSLTQIWYHDLKNRYHLADLDGNTLFGGSEHGYTDYPRFCGDL